MAEHFQGDLIRCCVRGCQEGEGRRHEVLCPAHWMIVPLPLQKRVLEARMVCNPADKDHNNQWSDAMTMVLMWMHAQAPLEPWAYKAAKRQLRDRTRRLTDPSVGLLPHLEACDQCRDHPEAACPVGVAAALHKAEERTREAHTRLRYEDLRRVK